MANHVRRQIREAIATAVTGLVTTGARVYQWRAYPLQTADLPALLVYARSEVSTTETINAPAMQSRSLTVDVVGVAKATADLDDTLDQISKEVETALANPVASLASGLAESLVLQSVNIDIDGSGEKPTGSITMTYQVDYSVIENAPDVAK